jgi:hypothetical protein
MTCIPEQSTWGFSNPSHLVCLDTSSDETWESDSAMAEMPAPNQAAYTLRVE